MVSFNGQEGVLREQIARLEAQVQALQANEERTSVALAQSSVGVFDWDLEHRRVYLFPVLQSLLGYEQVELPNDLTQWLNHLDDSDRFRAEQARTRSRWAGGARCDSGSLTGDFLRGVWESGRV